MSELLLFSDPTQAITTGPTLTMLEIIQQAIKPYGWKAAQVGKDYHLSNRKGYRAAIIKGTPEHYRFVDGDNRRLLIGHGDLSNSLIVLLTECFYAVTDEELSRRFKPATT